MKKKILKKLKYLLKFIPNKMYLKIYYRIKIGKKLNLKSPETFNEKLNWLKLNNIDKSLTTLVDKYLVKDYVAEKIGGVHCTNLICLG